MKTVDQAELIISLTALGAGLIFFGLRSLKQKRAIQDTPTSEISSASTGLVKIQGYAWPTKPHIASSGSRVAYHSVKIEEHKGSGENSKWVTVYSKETTDEIVVIDSSGFCAIFPIDASLYLESKTTGMKQLSSNQKKNLLEMYPDINQYFPSISDGAFASIIEALTKNDRRVTEHALFCGSPVYAKGHFEAESHASLKALDGIHKFFELIKSRPNVDRADAGKTASQTKQLRIREAHQYLQPNNSTTVNTAGTLRHSADHQLLFGDRHQGELLKSFGARPYLFILGGILFISAGIFVAAT